MPTLSRLLQITLVVMLHLAPTEVLTDVLPNKYEIITPIHLHPRRHKRDLSTREQDGHLSDTSFGFTARGRQFILDIYLNRHFLSENFLIGYQTLDGNVTMEKFTDHCYYHGLLVGSANSSVVLSTCNGLRGTIQDENGQLFGIEPRLSQTEEHIFYDLEDVPKKFFKCGVKIDHAFDSKSIFTNHFRTRRSLENKTKYVALVLINDKRQYEKYNNISRAVARALEIGNHVDQLLKTVKARAAIVYVETWNVRDLANIYLPAGKTLNSIRVYNKDVLVYKLLKQKIRRDNVQLITGIDFEGRVVGMAGIGTICGLSSTGVNMDFASNAGIAAGTVAHELGHNLGMAHDTGGCTCNGSPCVMAAVGGGVPVGFSQCSKRDLDLRVKEGLASCLFDVPDKLFGPPVCGNDFLEAGEECDCGSIAECIANKGSKCCNATSCKLHDNAQCAVGACCKDCKFIRQGVTCRKRETECDLEEVCTGVSHECPANFYKEDGTSCKNDMAYCFEGGCRTHDEQCERLWGKGASKAHYACFTENKKGDAWSSCGKSASGAFQKCADEDVLCGTIQCKNSPNKYPILGTGDMSKFQGVNIFYEGKWMYITCRQGITSLGPDLDNPTVTQQGTKCGEGKLCFDRKCRNMTSLSFIKPCPKGKCFNNGICNNMGNCHCPLGFACPDCRHPGLGGSTDSGHQCYVGPKRPGSLSTLGKSLLITFLGVVPFLAIVTFLLFKFLACSPFFFATSRPTDEGPNVEDPNAVDPNAEDPNAVDPDAEVPNVEDPNVEDPNTEDPNTEDPNAESPNTEVPNVEEPGPNEIIIDCKRTEQDSSL